MHPTLSSMHPRAANLLTHLSIAMASTDASMNAGLQSWPDSLPYSSNEVNTMAPPNPDLLSGTQSGTDAVTASLPELTHQLATTLGVSPPAPSLMADADHPMVDT